ncbi:MAG: hypothetical protein WBX01_17310 [Nitrososphaeraceae archaeon]
MNGKPRWACTACGMYSSRRYSVKRHIANLHDGLANIVSFVDYLAGRRQGVYWQNPIPSYIARQFVQPQSAAPTHRPADIMKEELFRSVLRKRFGYQ